LGLKSLMDGDRLPVPFAGGARVVVLQRSWNVGAKVSIDAFGAESSAAGNTFHWIYHYSLAEYALEVGIHLASKGLPVNLVKSDLEVLGYSHWGHYYCLFLLFFGLFNQSEGGIPRCQFFFHSVKDFI